MTLRLQCWLFAIGAALFAAGTAPGFASTFGASATNIACFAGSWCFTIAALIQLRLSVITGKDEPVLKLRWVGEEAQREEFAREFKELLNAEVGGFVPLTLGTYQLGQ